MNKDVIQMTPEEFNNLPDELLNGNLYKELGFDSRQASQESKRIQQILDELKKREKTGGYKNWFKPGTPYGIENCPKHKAFFDATRDYIEVMFRAGNRVGKSCAGAFASTIWAVQDYPDWWEGHVFKGPLSMWACGKTVQLTRDTVQKEMLGPMGGIGNGMIPLERIKKVWARAGSPGSVDTVEVFNSYGDVSHLGFKSYDQKVDSFVGTAKHVIWLDEEPDELVANECSVRITTTKGRIINTVTPLNGLTQYIAQFDKTAAHLAGAQRIVGVYDD